MNVPPLQLQEGRSCLCEQLSIVPFFLCIMRKTPQSIEIASGSCESDLLPVCDISLSNYLWPPVVPIDDGFVSITTMSCQWCHPAGFRSLFVWQDQEELDMDKIDLPHASIHQCQITVDECLRSPRCIRCMWSPSQTSSSAVLERFCVQ